MSGPDRLRLRVGEAIVSRGLWEAGQRVAVAVSGGLDSICLLDLLARTARWHRAELSVVTVDHGTRAASAADADFVVALAGAYQLPVVRVTRALGDRASEADCRAARFEALDALSTDVVALAHHRDDQAETLLLNLLRGTGPLGLQGMAWRRGRYVRPLLEVARAELEAYAAHRALAWREDPTNAAPRFLRNRVRAEVVPLLEALRPGATEAIARAASLAAEQGALLDALLDGDPAARPDAEGWATAWVASAHVALVRRALSQALQPVTTAQIDAVRVAASRGAGTVLLGGGRSVVVDARRTVLRAAPSGPLSGG